MSIPESGGPTHPGRDEPDKRLESSEGGNRPRRAALGELALLMLRLGCTAFGGPAVHIAMLEEEVVRRRGWMTREQFLDLLGATNLIPGPNSTEMVIHTGMRRGGALGLWLAGICFIAPAALLTLAFAWAYLRFGRLPAGQSLLLGVKPAVLAVILLAVWKLGRTAARTRALALLSLAVFALYQLHLSEIALLLGSGVVGILLAQGDRWRRGAGAAAVLAAVLGVGCWGGEVVNALPHPLTPSPLHPLTPSPATIGLYFLKIGSVLFGSGYVLLAFLQHGLVEHYRWLTPQQLVDAVAVGQFTPGPVSSTATFVGYVIGGVPGAAAATIGIFLPAFLLVWATNPLVPRLRRSRWAGGFLDGVNAGSVALMAGVLLQMGIATLQGWPSWLIAALAAVAVFGTRVNSVWVILGGAVMGFVLKGAF
jgi:chromate transporter